MLYHFSTHEIFNHHVNDSQSQQPELTNLFFRVLWPWNMLKSVGGQGCATNPTGGAYDVSYTPPGPLVSWGDTPFACLTLLGTSIIAPSVLASRHLDSCACSSRLTHRRCLRRLDLSRTTFRNVPAPLPATSELSHLICENLTGHPGRGWDVLTPARLRPWIIFYCVTCVLAAFGRCYLAACANFMACACVYNELHVGSTLSTTILDVSMLQPWIWVGIHKLTFFGSIGNF